MLPLISLILSALLFLLAAFNINSNPPRLQLGWLGAFFAVLSLLLGRL